MQVFAVAQYGPHAWMIGTKVWNLKMCTGGSDNFCVFVEKRA